MGWPAFPSRHFNGRPHGSLANHLPSASSVRLQETHVSKVSHVSSTQCWLSVTYTSIRASQGDIWPTVTDDIVITQNERRRCESASSAWMTSPMVFVRSTSSGTVANTFDLALAFIGEKTATTDTQPKFFSWEDRMISEKSSIPISFPELLQLLWPSQA